MKKAGLFSNKRWKRVELLTCDRSVSFIATSGTYSDAEFTSITDDRNVPSCCWRLWFSRRLEGITVVSSSATEVQLFVCCNSGEWIAWKHFKLSHWHVFLCHGCQKFVLKTVCIKKYFTRSITNCRAWSSHYASLRLGLDLVFLWPTRHTGFRWPYRSCLPWYLLKIWY